MPLAMFQLAPPEWERTTLGSIVERGGGHIQTGPFGSQLHASDYVSDGVPSIMPVNIGDNRLNRDGIACITEADAQRLSKHIVRKGDIIYSRRGDLERRALVRDAEDGWLCGTGCLKVRLGEGIIEPEFASYYLGHPDVRSWIVRHSVGITMPNLNTAIMEAVPFLLPPLPIQHVIAGVLRSLDDKIEQNRRMSRALERLARAIFRAWFVDFEPVKAKAAGATAFPPVPQSVFDGLPTCFVDSELGPIPEGWEAKPLYSTAQYVNGAAFRGEHFCERPDGLPVIKIAELKYGISTQTQFSNRVDLDSKYHIDSGDLLYSWSGSPDTSLDAFIWTRGPGLLNQHIFKVITRGKAQKHFVYYLLKHLRHTLVGVARDKQTTGLGHVTVADMRRIQVCWPSIEVLNGFDRQVGPLFELGFATAMESEMLVAMRDYLLPRLLSGAVRVGKAKSTLQEGVC